MAIRHGARTRKNNELSQKLAAQQRQHNSQIKGIEYAFSKTPAYRPMGMQGGYYDVSFYLEAGLSYSAVFTTDPRLPKSEGWALAMAECHRLNTEHFGEAFADAISEIHSLAGEIQDAGYLLISDYVTPADRRNYRKLCARQHAAMQRAEQLHLQNKKQAFLALYAADMELKPLATDATPEEEAMYEAAERKANEAKAVYEMVTANMSTEARWAEYNRLSKAYYNRQHGEADAADEALLAAIAI